jgi:hypothetical protein
MCYTKRTPSFPLIHLRFFRQSDLECAQGWTVHRRRSGVTIGGVTWATGMHCLYNERAGAATFLGKVVNMFHGKTDMMDDFVLFQLQNMPITTHMGHYCMFSNDTHTNHLVLWSRISWKCKVLKSRRGGDQMALPYYSCTPKELIEFR